MKKYIVTERLIHDGGAIEPGASIEIEDVLAGPLLRAGVIKPDPAYLPSAPPEPTEPKADGEAGTPATTSDKTPPPAGGDEGEGEKSGRTAAKPKPSGAKK